MYNKIFLTIILISLSACAGIGIKNSTDPYKKLEYAYDAMHQSRHIPAERLIKEAIIKFKESNDKAGLAEAYFTYGNYHKYEFNVKPLIKPSNPVDAVKYYDMAISLYSETGNRNGMAKSYFGKGNALIFSKKDDACKLYNQALNEYDPDGEKFLINQSFKTFPDMVNAFIEKFCI